MNTIDQEHLSAVTEMINDMHVDSPAELAQEEVLVAEMVQEIRDEEAFAMAYNALVNRVKARPERKLPLLQDDPDLLAQISERFDNYMLGSKPLAEIAPDRLTRGNELLKEGKKSALLIRADQYTDLHDDIIRPLMKLNGFGRESAEPFPKSADSLGHSRVHLDFFSKDTDHPYHYGLSLSQVEQGQVVFVSGLASSAVKGWSNDEYMRARLALNETNVINGLRERAMDRHNPHGTAEKTWEPHTKGVPELTAITMNQGDVAIWSQGGEGFKLPAWHGFIQVGNPNRPDFVPRKSTSYHLS